MSKYGRKKTAVLSALIVVCVLTTIVVSLRWHKKIDSLGTAPISDGVRINPFNTAVLQTNDENNEMGRPEPSSPLKGRSALPIDNPSLDDINLVMAGLPSSEENEQGWELMRGYGVLTEEDIEIYGNYDESTLESLAKNGDIRALQLIANRAMDNVVNDSDKAYMAAFEAVVHGSTQSAMAIAFLKQDQRVIYPDTPEYKEALIESLAWFEYGIMRGDPYMKFMLRDTLKNERFKNLNKEDFRKVRAVAKSIYADILQERRQRGLGECKNENAVEELENFYNVLSGDYNATK